MDSAEGRPCCSPVAERPAGPRSTAPLPAAALLDVELIEIEGTTFTMGTNEVFYPGDGEGPERPVTMSPYAMAPTAVSNDAFVLFVAATGYQTEAEQFGWSFVFGGLLPDDFAPTRAMVGAQWWRQVEGADWAHPEGPHSDIDRRGDHPVIHVSWNDAQVYCAWSGTRLPTEAEWEHAARAAAGPGLFPWGDELEPDGEHRMNVWQGSFPDHNTGADGWLGTAPANSYPPNGLGLHNMCGNVWEWCADVFTNRHSAEPTRDPVVTEGSPYRVLKGGSYLCHASYCRRYRITARSHNTPDSSNGNTGFRVVRSR